MGSHSIGANVLARAERHGAPGGADGDYLTVEKIVQYLCDRCGVARFRQLEAALGGEDSEEDAQ